MRIMVCCLVLVLLAISPALSENLLQNPGFEHDGGWSAYESAGMHEQWRARNGECNAGLMGEWSGEGMNGMIEQRDIPVIPGRRYLYSAWVWGDLGWRPYEQFLKVIFYDEDAQVIRVEQKALHGIHPMWSEIKFHLSAPLHAAFASVCIGASGVSSYGALTVDDVYFGEVSEYASNAP